MLNNYLNLAIQKLKPNSEYAFKNYDYSTIEWFVLDGDAPTNAQIDAAIEQIKADEITEAATKATQRQAILDRLGLTSEEANLLLSQAQSSEIVLGFVADSGEATGLKYTNALSDFIIKGFEEDVNVVASAATGTINFDVSTASVWYYTSNATANHTLNFRYSSGVSLNTAMATGDAITLVWLNTNGATPYYPNVINIDGSAVTPKVPAAISAGNASAIDAYSFTIIKTASATFTVLETQTKFA